MILKCLSETYHVRRLTEKDIPDILALAQTNPLYYQHNPPAPTKLSIKQDMVSVPPKVSVKNKCYVGFFKEDNMVALMDLILAYPDKETCWIGLLMVHQKYQYQGVGSRVVKEALSYLHNFYKTVRLGYIATNKQSEHFWLKNGFQPTGEEYPKPGYVIKVMAKRIE